MANSHWPTCVIPVYAPVTSKAWRKVAICVGLPKTTGTVTFMIVPFTIARRRTASLLGLQMRLPSATQVDRRLVAGGLLFGIGWGIAGFCPGPALVALGMGEQKALVFVAAMLAGMGVFELLERRKSLRAAHA